MFRSEVRTCMFGLVCKPQSIVKSPCRNISGISTTVFGDFKEHLDVSPFVGQIPASVHSRPNSDVVHRIVRFNRSRADLHVSRVGYQKRFARNHFETVYDEGGLPLAANGIIGKQLGSDVFDLDRERCENQITRLIKECESRESRTFIRRE